MIYFDNISKIYPPEFVALQDITLSIESGEFVSVVGESGAGKSTLLKLLYAEEMPTEGSVHFFERSTADIKRRFLPYYRRNFGMVFQDYKLLINKTVFENVAFALEVDGWTTKDIRSEVEQILSVVGLKEKNDLYPKQLSGGESQRVSMARALVHRPKVLIADEPTGNLDPKSAQAIVELLLKINDLGMTVLLATHGQEAVNAIQKRVVTMKGGRIVSDKKEGKYTI